MTAAARLTFRLHRFEIVALTALTLVLVVASLLVAERLRAIGFGRCQELMSLGRIGSDCEALAQAFYEVEQSQASPIAAILALMPYAAGLFLGIPIVARELERGTARLTWSIGPSRLRWYVGRALPVVVVVGVLTYAAGVVGDLLFAARSPALDPANAFDAFGQRGVLLAAQGLVLVAGAAGLGAVIGRQLPALILAVILGPLGVVGVGHLDQRLLAAEAVPRGENQVKLGDRWIDQRFQLPDGRVVSWQELEIVDPQSMIEGPTYPTVNFVIPGERYREIETREAVALVGLSLVMLAGTAVIVGVRRPA